MLAGIRKKKPSAPLSSADDVEIQKMAYQNREKFQLLDRKHFEIMIKDWMKFSYFFHDGNDDDDEAIFSPKTKANTRNVIEKIKNL